MKKFFVLFAVIVVLGINGFAQKKTPVDPCLSKDPKIRATSKKPCPSAPPQKKTVVPPEESNKTPKKPANKSASVEDSTFSMTIEHNGVKTAIMSEQFKTIGGQFLTNSGDPKHPTMLNYGASNDTDERNFSFQGWTAAATAGTYTLPSDLGITIMTSVFPNVPIFAPKTGTLEIKTMPAPGGFVVGTFTMVSENVTNDGKIETYNISGNFSLYRMN